MVEVYIFNQILELIIVENGKMEKEMDMEY